MKEADWQRQVTDWATLRGWRFVHFRPAINARGHYQTAMSGSPGWPDLALVRERFMVIELKSTNGRLTEGQNAWLKALSKAGVEAHVLRPKDFDRMIEVLR